MPELPEVETTCRGLTPKVVGKTVAQVIVRQPRLRWPVSSEIQTQLPGQPLLTVGRRGKYLIFHTPLGDMLVHLGMSGRLCVVDQPPAAGKHDHVDFILADGACMRYTDPRRFGAILWCPDWRQHPLLHALGVEPLSEAFSASYLYELTRTRKTCIKQLIMNAHIVVGVGNIYASEALYMAGIRPDRESKSIGEKQLQQLVDAIKQILQQAIKAGGTSLKDFYRADGKPGYFQQTLQVYGKQGSPCPQCAAPLKKCIIANRSSVFCEHCQQ